MLRCINHLETPTGGKILFHGEEVKNTQSSLSKYRSQVGMVFQSFNLFNNMTVLKNCMFGVQKILHLSKEEAKLRAIKHLREVGMAAYIQAGTVIRWTETESCHCKRSLYESGGTFI